jgi:hypothetical protein
VLKSKGFFFYADVFENDINFKEMLLKAGFNVVTTENITDNVLKALNKDSK